MNYFKTIFLFLAGLHIISGVYAKDFSFAAVSDIHHAQDIWLNTLNEFQSRGESLIVVAGDMAPDSDRYIDFENVFYMGAQPVFLPVPGNHETDDGIENYNYMRDKILPGIRGIVRADNESCSYYYDYEDSRFIAVDAYVRFGMHGVINDLGRAWVENVIKDAPENIKNIFIFFHEPGYPQIRHVGDSFDEDPVLRDAFWQMLGKYQDKVKAVFSGHTHYYYRSQHEGIWQVSTGTIGNGPQTIFIEVSVTGDGVRFKTFSAPKGEGQPFDLLESWDVANNLTTVL